MKILAERKPALSVGNEDELQDVFVETLKENPLYGSCFFHVKKAECDRNVADLPNNMVRVSIVSIVAGENAGAPRSRAQPRRSECKHAAARPAPCSPHPLPPPSLH